MRTTVRMRPSSLHAQLRCDVRLLERHLGKAPQLAALELFKINSLNEFV